MFGLARAARLCHSMAMTRPTPVAGGFFLVLPIIVGFVAGLLTGRAMAGVVIGLGIGLLLLLILWLLDRRRRG